MKKRLTIGWLYSELMNTYGDRGNIITLIKRCSWRDIECKVKYLNLGFNVKELKECDLLFMGGAQDRQQKIVAKDLKDKTKILKELIKKGIPGLYICGAYQFLGKYYKNADKTIIQGLGIFDLYTENPGEKEKRLIGNIAARSDYGILIGFENHGGRTILEQNAKPLGDILSGLGNNGQDKSEGTVYKNSIGTYLHGPILPKNPVLADFLIQTALEIKYKEKIVLKRIDDSLETKTRKAIAKRLSITI